MCVMFVTYVWVYVNIYAFLSHNVAEDPSRPVSGPITTLSTPAGPFQNMLQGILTRNREHKEAQACASRVIARASISKAAQVRKAILQTSRALQVLPFELQAGTYLSLSCK